MNDIIMYSVKEAFGIDLPMGDFKVPGFKKGTARHAVPTKDPAYVWSLNTLLPLVNTMVNPRAPIMLVGERGCGKTQAFKNFCAELNIPLYLLAHNEDTLATEPIFTMDVVDGETVTLDGLLIQAAVNGGFFVADEITQARAGVVVRYNSVADKNPILHDRYGDPVKIHPLFRFGATSNKGFLGGGSGIYAGAKRADASTDDRFRVAEIHYLEADVEIKALLRAIPEMKKTHGSWVKNLVKLANSLRASYVAREFPVPISTRTLVSICEDLFLNGSERFAIEWNITNKLSADEYKLTVTSLFRDIFGRDINSIESDSSSHLPRS